MTREPVKPVGSTRSRARSLRRVAAVILALGAVGIISPDAAAAKVCGRASVPGVDAREKVRVVRGPMSCGAAHRQIARAFDVEPSRHWDDTGEYGVFWRVHGWRCTIGLEETETFCRRDGREVDRSFRHDDGSNF